MIKLTTAQKHFIFDELDIPGGFDFNDPAECKEYARLTASDWYLIEPGENEVETTDEYYPHSIQYENQGQFYEIDCIGNRLYSLIMVS